MDEAQRAAIFELRGRTPPVPYARIAEQLGIPESQVYREHKRPAPTGRNGVDAEPVAGRRAAPARSDPELDAAEKRVEVLRLTLQEHELQRRLALLDGKAAGQETAMGSVVALLSEQMRRMEENVDRRLAMAQPTKPAEDPMASMVRGISTLADLQQKVQLLAPPPPVPASTNAADVELRVLLEKLNIETEASRARAAQEAERSAFIFSAAKDNLPLIIEGVKSFFENQKRPPEAARPSLQVLEGGQTQMVAAPIAEVPMTCSACFAKYMVRPEPGELPTCTVCGGPLQDDAQKITPAPAKVIWPEDATFG